MRSTRLRRISAANIVPNLFYLNRTVSWLTPTPRSCSRSSRFRSDTSRSQTCARAIIGQIPIPATRGIRTANGSFRFQA